MTETVQDVEFKDASLTSFSEGGSKYADKTVKVAGIRVVSFLMGKAPEPPAEDTRETATQIEVDWQLPGEDKPFTENYFLGKSKNVKPRPDGYGYQTAGGKDLFKEMPGALLVQAFAAAGHTWDERALAGVLGAEVELAGVPETYRAFDKKVGKEVDKTYTRLYPRKLVKAGDGSAPAAGGGQAGGADAKAQIAEILTGKILAIVAEKGDQKLVDLQKQFAADEELKGFSANDVTRVLFDKPFAKVEGRGFVIDKGVAKLG
jgi:hypothetical protein